MCKHILAAIIADVIGKKHSVSITEEHLKSLFLDISDIW